jgi:uncharacterized membrane protein
LTLQKVRSLWDSLRSSLWFLPALMVAGAVGLALALIEVDTRLGPGELERRWPSLFGVGAAGARGMLSAIVGSMITVAGVAFSITVVALTLASSQYTSRILRNFMRDHANQAVLGVFTGVFAYCLVVLRTIRGGDEGAFVPSLAVLFAVALALVAIGFLIFFIHHISTSIQAASIIKAAADETIEAVDRLFPDNLGEQASLGEGAAPVSLLDDSVWYPIPALRTGYVQGVDGGTLIRFARERRAVVRMERGVGEFVVEGSAVASLGGGAPPDKETAKVLDAAYTIGRQRTMVQDAGFGVRQIVDVALKALSPGVNDTTTAVTCVEYLSAILARLASRRVETPYRAEGGELRVVARGPTFRGLLDTAFDQVRQNAGGNGAVLLALLQSLEVVAGRARDPGRRQALRRHAGLIADAAARSIPVPQDRESIEAVLERLTPLLRLESADGTGELGGGTTKPYPPK